ncbi:MAG: hypothetical protein GPOALKHO_000233 [Sodalis sp.]|nr:MAG: hypothetical protein GPOALKHO_000233 [Sodalis sp.]
MPLAADVPPVMAQVVETDRKLPPRDIAVEDQTQDFDRSHHDMGQITDAY